jgi:hypothetical protein
VVEDNNIFVDRTPSVDKFEHHIKLNILLFIGLPDVDCVDNALCCFDGCVNACFNTNMDTPEPPPLTTPSPDAKSAPEPTTPASKPPKEQETIPPEQVAQASNEVEKKVPAPEPTTTPKPYTTTPKPTTPKPTTPKPTTAKPRPPMPMEVR